MSISPQLKQQLLTFQRNEITEYHIYGKLAHAVKDQHASSIFQRIADDEKGH